MSTMYKKKTHKASSKRFKITGTGKIMRHKAFGSHILTKKTSKRKRAIRKATEVHFTNAKIVRTMINKKSR